MKRAQNDGYIYRYIYNRYIYIYICLDITYFSINVGIVYDWYRNVESVFLFVENGDKLLASILCNGFYAGENPFVVCSNGYLCVL